MQYDAIILVEGLSSRMGSDNTLLLNVGPEPMLAHGTRTYLSACKGNFIVVTGYQVDLIETALAHLPVQFVHNPEFVDQPILCVENLQLMLHVHQGEPSKVTVLYCGGQPGNPSVIPSDLRLIMLQNPKSAGCRKFTRKNLHLVKLIDMASSRFFADIDTPQEYHNLTNTMKRVNHDMAI